MGAGGVKMVQNSRSSLQIDLNEFKLHLRLQSRTQLTLHFDSPSRGFYLSVIALVVHEMKKSGKVKSIPLQQHLTLLALLNETIGGAAGSSEEENLLHRIYRKWKDALPNLEEAPLFKVLGKKKEAGDGTTGKVYSFDDAEKDEWANLFEYLGSNENVRLKFALDKIGVGLNETSIVFGDSLSGEAWEKFISSLKKREEEEKGEFAPGEETAVPEPPAVPISAPQKPKISWRSRYRWVMLVVVLGVVAGVIWKIFLSPAPIEVASVDRMKFPLPEEPSIAVLPFVNLSEDPKQEFLCDGMAEAIITALCRVPRMFVISRNSTFTYKGKPVKVKQVSEELGVRYVLEGSVQRAGDRIRIHARLIDALSGGHLWAKHYDREVKDVFAVQDEVTLKIIRALQVNLADGESCGAYAFKGSQNLDCYLKGIEALKYFERFTPEGNDIARRLIQEALSLCPDNVYALCFLGKTYFFEIRFGKAKSPKESFKKAIELVQKAIALDNNYAYGHVWLGFFYLYKREYGKAIDEGELALALSPSSADIHALCALVFSYSGRPEGAIPLAERAIRLNPFAPSWYYNALGHAYKCAGQYEEAVSGYKKALQLSPDNFFTHVGLTSVYSMTCQEKEARAEAAEVLRINPKFSLDKAAGGYPYKDQSQADKFINALRKAGLK